jgi:hypothetical protein
LQRECESIHLIKSLGGQKIKVGKYWQCACRTIAVLAELPKMTRHPAMIPFGETAFFPGNLIHTNECLVEMGKTSKYKMQETHNIKLPYDLRKPYPNRGHTFKSSKRS